MIKIGFITINLVDILDIFLVTIFIYQVFKLIRGSVAINIFSGFISIYIAYLLLNALGFRASSEILGQFIEVGVIALIIVFQQEIRKFLQYIGISTGNVESFSFNYILKKLFKKRTKNADHIDIRELSFAIKEMSLKKIGALIVLASQPSVQNFIETGETLNAQFNVRLIHSIFNKFAPLHDGAVFIDKSTIIAAGCLLPLSQRRDLPKQFGTRHRAAIGISDVCDGLVVAISEETGHITFAQNNHYLYNIPHHEIESYITEYIKRGVFTNIAI